jgi:hypothetical protein
MTNMTHWSRGGLAMLTVASALMWSAHFGPHGRAVMAASVAAVECEGTACQQITLTFDEAKQQYRVQNSSTDRWVRVSAANVAASAFACVGPGKSEDLPLRSIAGSYHADYSDQTCGTGGGE